MTGSRVDDDAEEARRKRVVRRETRWSWLARERAPEVRMGETIDGFCEGLSAGAAKWEFWWGSRDLLRRDPDVWCANLNGFRRYAWTTWEHGGNLRVTVTPFWTSVEFGGMAVRVPERFALKFPRVGGLVMGWVFAEKMSEGWEPRG